MIVFLMNLQYSIIPMDELHANGFGDDENAQDFDSGAIVRPVSFELNSGNVTICCQPYFCFRIILHIFH